MTWGLALILMMSGAAAPTRGITGAPELARVYDTILDADFAAVPRLLEKTCPPAAPEACQLLEALSIWWRIALDPASRQLDASFSTSVERALAAASAWTMREPERAEAWFCLGGAYGARAQWRVLRRERLAAARDGKRIKDALERALALDPGMHDAKFGIGMYRYYADIAPAALRMLRWMLLLPGGDRVEGLRLINEARERGQLVGGEAEYQLHLIDLWYERRQIDALALVKRLQSRYPHNPLFRQIEAEMHDAYFHDPKASLAASSELLALAAAKRVHEPALAAAVARLHMANALTQLGERARAEQILTQLIAEHPIAPADAMTRARALLKSIARVADRARSTDFHALIRNVSLKPSRWVRKQVRARSRVDSKRVVCA